ncbi:ATP-dependent Lon protease [Vibrio maerlii]|uniref:ATP-dependent Lon protease n=1 Tax=Vibrio maerlii TaxID=2231648 RepID=UPI000E3D86DB|nr:ATP-dependent Lon protease [Vibrio maerlii]
MIVSPNSVSVPLITPSVNVQTEQAARDNKVREPIQPTVELAKANAERKVKADDKRRKQSAWDPSEHPEYDVHEEEKSIIEEPEKGPMDRLFELLALSSYSESQGKGYTMRFKLPKKVLEAAIMQTVIEKRRVVIKYHYGHAVAPHTPSDVIAVL